MLQFINQDFNFNGQSIVDENQIANFYGNFNKSNESINNINISFNIIDIEQYLANKETVDADFISFKNSLMDKVAEEGE